jgi:hypothetical protein
MIILRVTFDYLVGIRYLSGNPWIAVKDPSVKKKINDIQIHKALSFSLWNKVIAGLERCAADSRASGMQCRIGLAACLLMGDSGLRCEEVTTVRRPELIKSTFAEQVYECRVTRYGRYRFNTITKQGNFAHITFAASSRKFSEHLR